MGIFSCIVNDPDFAELICRDIMNNGCSVAQAIANYQAGKIYQGVLHSLPSVEDSRIEIESIFNQLSFGGREEVFHRLITDYPGPTALLTEDMSVAESMALPPNIIRGLLTRAGGPTSHLFIGPKARGIHCLYGLHSNYDRVRDGDVIAIDGLNRKIIVNPDEDTLLRIRQMAHNYNALHIQAQKRFRFKNPCISGAAGKGKRQIVVIRGNVASEWECKEMVGFGLNEAGLFRTELADMTGKDGVLREAPKTEDELVAYYGRLYYGTLVESVVERTADNRPEKPLPGYRPITPGTGLSLEGIGLSLAYRYPPDNLPGDVSKESFKPFDDYFCIQLRALLRVSGMFPGRSKIEFPYVQNYQEWRRAHEFLAEIKKGLRKEKKKFDPNLKEGVMVEVPWLVGDELRCVMLEADFASFGGNDMLRNFFHIDRDVPLADVLQKAYDPEFIKLLGESIKIVNEVARGRRRKISYQGCGEMSSDLLLIPIQIGLGLYEFSVSPPKAPIIKYLINSLYLRDLRDILIPRVLEATNSTTARRQAVETYRELQRRNHFPKGRFFNELLKSAES